MAASVNNIAATFASCHVSPKPTTTPLDAPTSLILSGSLSPPSVSWNPQAKLPISFKSSFVGLYGGPGPRNALSNSVKRNPLHATRSRNGATIRASIAVGEKLPDATLSYFDKEDKLQTITVSELTKGKKVVLFAVPGAFTPTCSQKHVPGFIDKADELKANGVETTACISVNDAFVMKAWGQSLNVGDKVFLLADGNGEFTKALGVTLDLSDKPAGLSVRSRRYALLAEDGVVKVFNLEEGGAFTVSSAEEILKAL
eukprot:Gb_21938 [translate_table: standard]